MKIIAAIFIAGVLFYQPAHNSTAPKPRPVSQAKINCVAKAIYHEARSEPYRGQVLVAQVVINRARHGGFGSGVCGVIAKPSQFSWYLGAKQPQGYHWQQAKYLAQQVLENGAVKPSTALWFHNHTVQPAWAKQRRLLYVVGNHKFYS